MALILEMKCQLCHFKSPYRHAMFLLLIKLNKLNLLLQGTRSALYANERESITVTVQEVTPRSVGALIALYERAVGIYASLVNINAYHQPGKYLFMAIIKLWIMDGFLATS